MRFWLPIVFFLFASCATTPPITTVHRITDLEVPSLLPGERVRERTGYKVSFNSKERIPNWVAYSLSSEKALSRLVDRKERHKKFHFRRDEEEPSCPSYMDYTRSSYERGHMVPAQEMRWSIDAMRDSFLMTNITPQSKAFNNGVWKRIEEIVQRGAEQASESYVVSGPVLADRCLKHIGEKKDICVPRTFFKVVLMKTRSGMKAAGFIVPHEGNLSEAARYATSVDAVEKVTGRDFFSALPDEIENSVESQPVEFFLNAPEIAAKRD